MVFPGDFHAHTIKLTSLLLLLFNPIQSYSTLFNLIQSYSILFNFIQFFQSYSILFNLVQFYSILFNLIQSYSILFKFYSISFTHYVIRCHKVTYCISLYHNVAYLANHFSACLGWNGTWRSICCELCGAPRSLYILDD